MPRKITYISKKMKTKKVLQTLVVKYVHMA